MRNNDHLANNYIDSGTGWSLWGIGKIRILNFLDLSVPNTGLTTFSAHKPTRLAQTLNVGYDNTNKTNVNILLTNTGYLYCANPSNGNLITVSALRGSLMWSVD